MQVAGLIHGKELHHLDHLAPLCALEGIPLILTDEHMLYLAKTYYPDLKTYTLTPDSLIQQFDTILYTTPRILFDQVYYLASALQKKQIETIWCPHGNSMKGKNSPFFEALENETLILTYGPQMEKLVREKGIKAPFHRIGNYRLAYYQKHRKFYDNLLKAKQKKTILYAPTWQDGQKSSSFSNVWKELLSFKEDAHLMIKLHPNLYHQYPKEIQKLKKHYELIEDFPPIYPLLNRVDILIGDHSSINYDFMVFKRPIVQIDPKKGGGLFREGEVSTIPTEQLFGPYRPLKTISPFCTAS